MTDSLENAQQPGEQRPSETGRVEAFSDGVFAIAITLLILEIKVPASGGAHLSDDLAAQWPSYLSFLGSFVTIGVMWINHHRLFTLIDRTDNRLLFLNLLLLLGVTWIPFPTAVIAEHVGKEGDRTAALLYAVSFFIIAIFFNVLWRHATGGGRLLAPGSNRQEVESITHQYRYGPLWYGIAIAMAFWNAPASLATCLALAFFFAVPPKRATTRRP